MARVFRDIYVPESALDRFWNTVRVGAPEECWLWKGIIEHAGYGVFNSDRTHKNYRAHRVSWYLKNERQPEGVVCHSCDNPRCVNPAHLWVGTDADNVRDMVSKGRHWATRKTVCKHGHPLTGRNVWIYRNNRVCRACDTNRNRTYRQRLSQALKSGAN